MAVVDRAVECAFADGLDADDLDAVLAVLAWAAEAGLAVVARAFACAVVAALDDAAFDDDDVDALLAAFAWFTFARFTFARFDAVRV